MKRYESALHQTARAKEAEEANRANALASLQVCGADGRLGSESISPLSEDLLPSAVPRLSSDLFVASIPGAS